MKDPKKLSVSDLIELHLELKGEAALPDEQELETNMSVDDSTLPPRRDIFPSKKPTLTRLFYNTLFVLFLILVVGLTVWGSKMN